MSALNPTCPGCGSADSTHALNCPNRLDPVGNGETRPTDRMPLALGSPLEGDVWLWRGSPFAKFERLARALVAVPKRRKRSNKHKEKP